MVDEVALTVTITRESDDLLWEVANVGTSDVAAFLLVPSLVEDGLTFAVDTAWSDREPDGTLLLRKVTAEPPADQFVDAVPSGAIRLAPGARQSGRITLGCEVGTRPAYGEPGETAPVVRVALEVGWVLWPGGVTEMLDWEGQPFAYLDPSDERPQHLARSTPLEWEP